MGDVDAAFPLRTLLSSVLGENVGLLLPVMQPTIFFFLDLKKNPNLLPNYRVLSSTEFSGTGINRAFSGSTMLSWSSVLGTFAQP